MKFRFSFLAICIAIMCLSAKSKVAAQALPAYAMYNSEGAPIDFGRAVDLMAESDVVLFGEFHDNALVHWLQLRTAKALSEKKSLVMGGEMFESDNQLLLDEYLSGLMTGKVFEDQARLWPNYKTDYKPLVNFAAENGIPFIATNVPRRYASLVAREGLDTLETLGAASKVLMPELPIAFSMETPGYEEMIEMMGGGHRMGFKAENFVRAQALKDAAMAENILRNRQPESVFLHFNGDFHSADYGGIYWYLTNTNPEIKVTTIKIFSEENINFQDDWVDSGDIILTVPADFTSTH